MPNQFSIEVPDALGTIAQYRQQVGAAAFTEAQARREAALAETEPERQRANLQALALQNKKAELANTATEKGLASDEEFQRLLREVDPSLPVADKLGSIASSALRVGRFEEAEKAIRTIDTIANHESLRDARQERQDLARANAGAKRLDRIISLMQGMTDSTSKALMEDLYRQEFGQEPPTAKFPFSENLRKSAIAAAEKAKGEGAQAAEDALIAARLAAVTRADKVAGAQVELYNARTQAVRDRVTSGVKDGGKAAAPTKAEQSHAAAKLRVEFPDLGNQERLLASMEIAADAKALQRREGGSYSDAVDQALEARRGQFLRVPDKYFGPLRTEKGKATYVPRNVAAAMEQNNDAVADVDVGGRQQRVERPAARKPPPPKKGDIYKGYRFKGGNPADRNSWEKVQ